MAIKGDFISFTYNGVHSTELGIVHVSASNRYTDALLPTIQDKTVLAAGSNGTYFFGSYYTLRLISLSVAYDEVSESLLRLIRKVLGDLLSHPLIFDEEPYKVYYAKVTGTPQYTYIPFSTPRVYKGEGTLTFTCYEPFAHTLNSLKYLSLFPEATEDKELSGSLVSFNDGIGNLKKLEVKFNLSQNFNGYSRPWPAGGGVNLFPDTLPADKLNATISTVDDQTVIRAANNARVFAIPCKQDTNYAFQHIIKTGGIIVAFSTKAPEIGDVVNNRRVLVNLDFWTTNSENNTYIIVAVTTEADFETLVSDGEMMVFEGSSELDDYYPYSNICPISGLTGLSAYVSPTQNIADATTYAEDWTSSAGTVYGGTIDVVTGVLTMDRAYVDMGTLTWTPNATDYMNFYTFDLQNVVKHPPGSDTGYLYVVCSAYASIPPVARDNCYIYVSNDGRIRVKDTVNASLTGAQFKTLMSGVQLVYELATPLTYLLTPQKVPVLEGLNNIWSNSGNVTLIYNKSTGKIEDWKLEWNPSANLLDELGLYDSYDSTTGFKLYNPGDIETDFKLIIPTSLSFVIDGIVASNSLTGESRILTTSITSAKEGDVSILFNSKTNLIEGLNALGARTGNIYNDCIASGEWFKIPLTTDGNWYLLILDYSNASGVAPEIVYDYLYL